MWPFDVVLSWQTESGPRTLIVEIDGSHHYYSKLDRIASQSTEFKYRIFDLYGLPYLRIECWNHMVEAPTGDRKGE